MFKIIGENVSTKQSLSLFHYHQSQAYNKRLIRQAYWTEEQLLFSPSTYFHNTLSAYIELDLNSFNFMF